MKGERRLRRTGGGVLYVGGLNYVSMRLVWSMRMICNSETRVNDVEMNCCVVPLATISSNNSPFSPPP